MEAIFGFTLIVASLLIARRTQAAPVIDSTISSVSGYFNVGGVLGSGVTHSVDVFARTLYGEGRGTIPKHGREKLENIANTIMNRWKLRQTGDGYKSFGPVGATIAEICQAPWQFSCWNNGDPNLPIIRNVTVDDPHFALCLDVAKDAMAGRLEDRTGGADHYFANTMAAIPDWARGVQDSLNDGIHAFKRLIG